MLINPFTSGNNRLTLCNTYLWSSTTARRAASLAFNHSIVGSKYGRKPHHIIQLICSTISNSIQLSQWTKYFTVWRLQVWSWTTSPGSRYGHELLHNSIIYGLNRLTKPANTVINHFTTASDILINHNHFRKKIVISLFATYRKAENLALNHLRRDLEI
jgi:hypothetical protein